MKKLLSLFLVLFHGALVAAFAQGPNDSGTYYSAADGQKGAALKTAFNAIIRNPKVVSYNGLMQAYTKTDVRADGYLRDWYSNITHFVPGTKSGTYHGEGDAYNREHLVPQSWFNEASPMKSDIVHVVPTDGYINNMRSDYPLGEVVPNSSNYKASANGYSKKGAPKPELKVSAGVTVVFEPNDEVKGDIARIYFYMATCYQQQILNWTNNTAGKVINYSSGTAYQPFQQWVFDMMMRWSKQDPIDEVEIARNNAVYTVQKNRNPFVDYPGLEEYIWGDKKDVAFSYDNYGKEPLPEDPENPENPENPEDPEDPEDPQIPDEPLLFHETFDLCAGLGGNDRLWGGNTSIGSAAFLPDHDGWDAGSSKVYGANQCVRLGTTRTAGEITTPQMAMTDHATIAFMAAPWLDGDKTITLSIAEGNATIEPTTFTMVKGVWTTCIASIKGEGKIRINIKGADRFFLDEVRLYGPEPPFDDEGEVTGIADRGSLGTADGADRSLYDLQGRRLAPGGSLPRGIYIRSGRKILIR